MKALEFLKQERDHYKSIHNDKSIIKKYNKAIEEVEHILEEKALLEEYVEFARNYIQSYRCKCGTLARKGYLCSNEECTEQ